MPVPVPVPVPESTAIRRSFGNEQKRVEKEYHADNGNSTEPNQSPSPDPRLRISESDLRIQESDIGLRFGSECLADRTDRAVRAPREGMAVR